MLIKKIVLTVYFFMLETENTRGNRTLMRIIVVKVIIIIIIIMTMIMIRSK